MWYRTKWFAIAIGILLVCLTSFWSLLDFSLGSFFGGNWFHVVHNIVCSIMCGFQAHSIKWCNLKSFWFNLFNQWVCVLSRNHSSMAFYENVFRRNQFNYPHAITSSKTSSIKRSWLVKFLILVNWHQCESSVLRDCVRWGAITSKANSLPL